MGTLRGGNGGGWPPEGLPDLPPEWGPIIIPDDASALAGEAAQVRRELRREARQQRRRGRLGLSPAESRPAGDGTPTLGVPLLVISIAVLAALTSLFAIAWPARSRQAPLIPTTVATGPPTPVVPAPAGGAPAAVPDVTLADPSGTQIRLRGLLPAVILLVDDGCDCAQLVTTTATATATVHPAISVVAVGARHIPVAGTPPAGTAARIWLATDAPGSILAGLPGLASVVPGGSTALLAAADGALIRVVPGVGSVDDIRPDLPRLTPGD